MPSKTKDKSTVELGSFGETKADKEHDMDEIPPHSSFYSPKFIAVLDKLSTLFGAPLTLLIYGLVSFFLSASSSEEISPASSGAFLVDSSVQVPSDTNLTTPQMDTLIRLQKILDFDSDDYFQGLGLTPTGGINATIITGLSKVFDKLIQSHCSACPITFAQLLKLSPDGVAAFARQSSNLVAIFKDDSFDPAKFFKQRYFGQTILPINKVSSSVYLRNLEEYSAEELTQIRQLTEAQYDHHHFSRDSLFFMSVFAELQRILHIFLSKLGLYLKLRDFVWASTFTTQLEQLEIKSRNGSLVDNGILPTFATIYMRRQNICPSIGVMSFLAFLSYFSSGLTHQNHLLISDVYRFTFSGMANAGTEWSEFIRLVQTATDTTFGPNDPSLAHPALRD